MAFVGIFLEIQEDIKLFVTESAVIPRTWATIRAIMSPLTPFLETSLIRTNTIFVLDPENHRHEISISHCFSRSKKNRTEPNLYCMFDDIMKKIKEFTNKLNDKGVPIPLARDNGKASMSATLVWLSASMVTVGLIGKWSGKLGTIDIENALQFFYASCALHWGKGFRSKSGAKVGDTKSDDSAS